MKGRHMSDPVSEPAGPDKSHEPPRGPAPSEGVVDVRDVRDDGHGAPKPPVNEIRLGYGDSGLHEDLDSDSSGADEDADGAAEDAVTWDAPAEFGAPSLSAGIEAILLVVDEPVSAMTLAQVLERPTGEVEEALGVLVLDYDRAERGFELREVAGGWRLYTRASCAAVVERFVVDGQQARLTQAALETLAVVAYRQPVSRARISAVRGVNVDGVIRTLLSRGLVEESGAETDSGAILYRTTSVFLERLGLRSADELPALAPLLPDIESIDINYDSL